jgi:hypothetical protein
MSDNDAFRDMLLTLRVKDDVGTGQLLPSGPRGSFFQLLGVPAAGCFQWSLLPPELALAERNSLNPGYMVSWECPAFCN